MPLLRPGAAFEKTPSKRKYSGMITKRLLMFSLLFLPSLLQAQMSAQRDPEVDSSFYEERYLGHRLFEISSARSAHGRAKISPQESLPLSQRWRSEEIQRRFEIIRDYPIVDGKWSPSWLYPEDGCFARASMANKTAFHQFFPLPGKVFAFGNLTVQTSHSPRGRVSWWYHVAPVVEVDGEKFVLDPAIEFTRPLHLKEWLGRMGDPEKIKVSFCGSGTYVPSDSCDEETDGLELGALKTQRSYLKLEAPRR